MKTRIFHSLFAICLALMAGFSVSGTARADDTDMSIPIPPPAVNR